MSNEQGGNEQVGRIFTFSRNEKGQCLRDDEGKFLLQIQDMTKDPVIHAFVYRVPGFGSAFTNETEEGAMLSAELLLREEGVIKSNDIVVVR